jgi:membrane-associated protease RseP (regulator of RpoE activity)
MKKKENSDTVFRLSTSSLSLPFRITITIGKSYRGWIMTPLSFRWAKKRILLLCSGFRRVLFLCCTSASPSTRSFVTGKTENSSVVLRLSTSSLSLRFGIPINKKLCKVQEWPLQLDDDVLRARNESSSVVFRLSTSSICLPFSITIEQTINEKLEQVQEWPLILLMGKKENSSVVFRLSVSWSFSTLRHHYQQRALKGGTRMTLWSFRRAKKEKPSVVFRLSASSLSLPFGITKLEKIQERTA